MSFASGSRALAWLTVIEAARQRLWVLVVAVAALFAFAALRLGAVDEAARIKLAVVLITSGIGFVITLLAILVAAGGMRRDLENRTVLMLFSKPLHRLAYVGGRWIGTLVLLAAIVAVLAAVGALSTAARADLPAMRRTITPASWTKVTAANQVKAIPEERSQVLLGGLAGESVRWTFAGLPTGEDRELLLRASVIGIDDAPNDASLVLVTALPAAGQQPQALSLDAASPYGLVASGPTGAGRFIMRDRDESHHDLAGDYLRLRLPAAAILPDGSAVIQLTRIDPRSALRLSRDDGVLIAIPDGGFTLNLMRAGLVMLAGAGLLCAWTLLCAAVTNLGVTLLGGLTLYFAGNALPAVEDSLSYGETAQPARRLLELIQWIVPDFGRYNLGSRLAATEAVTWHDVGSAWGYYGIYATIFLAVAWLALSKREL